MFSGLLVALVALLVAAKLGGALAERLGQPAVLGELLAGIALGALPLLGVRGLEYVARDHVVEALADLGVVLLLFEVGLSTRLAELMKVGLSAFLVASVGVVVPMALGFGVGLWLLPGRHPYVPLFLGATLCATSVGITARVLKDMGRVRTAEGQIILGAAVIDDVMGLLVLAVMVGLVGGARAGTGAVLAAVTAKAVGFLVGAFAAGLVLEGVGFGELLHPGDRLEDLLMPVSTLLVPLFFVRMGLQVDLPALAAGSAALALALTGVAVLGKQACGLAVVTRGVDRLTVGLGMIPRGEVGLIFAGMGLTLRIDGRPLLGPGEFAAVVAMVMLTTIVTPPLLKWRLGAEAAGVADVA